MIKKPLLAPQAAVCAAFLALALAGHAQPLSITTFAGTGSLGDGNGPALTAKFADPSGLAVDRATNVYVADTYSNVIRFITADATGTNWTVNTILGKSGAAGRVDGTNGAARFNSPTALAVDGATNMYLADTGNNQIRRIYLDGTNWIVLALAGATNGAAGSADGTNQAALFNGPSGLALDPAGRLFVADRVNNTVRQMIRDETGTNWVVSTFAGSAGPTGNRNGVGQLARFSSPNSLAFDAASNLYVADGGNYAIRMITPQGNVTTIAGGEPGLADGLGTNAQFDFPCGIAVDAATNVYVSDFYNCTVRRLSHSPSGWTVTTVAGNPLNAGKSDGVATLARFQFSNARNNPNGLALDAGGRLFIADSANCLVRTGTVFEGLLLLIPPENQTAVAGGSVTLNATAVGALPITYQWLNGSQPIAGATNASLTLANLQTNAAGGYSVVVSNTAGFSNSPVANLTVVLPLAISTVAGVGAVGSADGFGLAARFDGLGGVAVDPAGNVLVADGLNDTIRKVSPLGFVTTVAGSPQIPGNADGMAGGATFDFPYGVAVDTVGNTYVADTLNSLIREISAAGNVNTIAGLPGSSGYRDGPAHAALFHNPDGIAVNSSGVIYVADTLNNRIRAVSDGYVTTLAGDGAPGALDGLGTNAEFNEPFALAVDAAGNLFIADYGNSIIRKMTPDGTVTTIAGTAGHVGYFNSTNSAAQFNLPSGIAVDSLENVYVADYGNQIIRKISLNSAGNWAVTSPAGFPQVFGDSDGAALGARFHGPVGMAVDSLGFVYVGDSLNGVIRKVTPGGAVSTLAGPAHSFGLNDGAFPGGRLDGPRGVAADAGGNVYAADTVNNTIRQITPDGAMSTIAGLPGFGGAGNGAGSEARFSQPLGLAVDSATNLYVADFQNSIIRKMTFDPSSGDWTTATIAGTPGVAGYANGAPTNALLNGPWAVAVDASGDIYVSDYSNQVIRLITAAGVVTNYAGSPTHAGFGDGANAFFNFPTGIALDGFGNLYVADSQNQLIRKIAPGGNVSAIAGSYFTPGSADGNGASALFNNPQGLAVDALGNVFVADTGNNVIRQITPEGGVVTVAALAGGRGSRDGVGGGAQFDSPIGLAIAPNGNIYIADTLNNTIRQGSPYYGQALVLTPAFGRSVPVGAPVTLTPVVAGLAPLSYQWFDDGAELSGQTNLLLTIGAAQPGDAGNYELAVSNTFTGATSAPAAINVSQPPVIFAQPGDEFAAQNSNPSFAVTAFGQLPLSYQWSFNGVNLAGATNSILTIIDMQTTNAGAYQVAVSNAAGGVVSLLAELTLAAPPQIISGPSNQVGQCGSNVILTVQASGSAPLGYQWLAGSAPLGLATLPSLSVSNLVNGDAQSFTVVVTNAFGAATSLVAVVSIIDTMGPAITIIGAAATNVLVGGSFTDPGATADDLCSGPAPVVTNGAVNPDVIGTYMIDYRATDAEGNASTNARTVNVVPAAPVIVTQPGAQTNYPGATQTFTVNVTGTTPMAFQWTKNEVSLSDGGDISGATNQTLTIGPLSAADAGTYAVTVSNSAGVTVSSNAVLSIGASGTPVGVAGYNRDVVVESAATGGSTAAYAQVFDPTYPTFCFYETGLNASNVYGSSPTNLGLVPSGVYVSEVDGATLFQLAPYTANNVLYLTASAPSGALRLASPTNFDSLSILAASADGGGSGSWTIQFMDGTSSPAFNLDAPDWQGTSGGAVTHFGELYCGNYGQYYAYNLVNNFPSLYQTTVNLAGFGLNLKTIATLSFTKPSGATSVSGIFAVSGTVGPPLPPLRFDAPSLHGGALTFSLQTAPGQSYTLQQTTNLASGSWQAYSNLPGAGAPWQIAVPLTNRQQFFRVVEP